MPDKMLGKCLQEAHVVIKEGESRGFGFVTFDTAEAAQQAIEDMDGLYLDDGQDSVTELIVRQATNTSSGHVLSRECPEPRRTAKAANVARAHNNAALNKVFVGGLPWSVESSMLQDAFAQFGPVTSAIVAVDQQSGRSRGFGFVCFEDANAAQDAIDAMDGTNLRGRDISVRKADTDRAASASTMESSTDCSARQDNRRGRDRSSRLVDGDRNLSGAQPTRGASGELLDDPYEVSVAVCERCCLATTKSLQMVCAGSAFCAAEASTSTNIS